MVKLNSSVHFMDPMLQVQVWRAAFRTLVIVSLQTDLLVTLNGACCGPWQGGGHALREGKSKVRGAGVSNTDSFIEEVTEEVRRDRLFALMKRYGWILVLAVLLLVGGAAFIEYRKAQERNAAEATGDAMIVALRQNDPLDRAASLANLSPGSAGAQAVAMMLEAGEKMESGEFDAAIAELQKVEQNADLPLIYRQVAGFKVLALQGENLSAEERRRGYEALIGPGSAIRLLAEEQLALVEIEIGETEAAAKRLQAIASDANATAGLRQRASQLIVALGVEPEQPKVGSE